MWASHISEEVYPEFILLVPMRSVRWDWKSAHFSDCWYGFLLAERWTETPYTGWKRVRGWIFSLQSYSKENWLAVNPINWLRDGGKVLAMIRQQSDNVDKLLNSRSSFPCGLYQVGYPILVILLLCFIFAYNSLKWKHQLILTYLYTKNVQK